MHRSEYEQHKLDEESGRALDGQAKKSLVDEICSEVAAMTDEQVHEALLKMRARQAIERQRRQEDEEEEDVCPTCGQKLES